MENEEKAYGLSLPVTTVDSNAESIKVLASTMAFESESTQPFSVTQLNRQIRLLLEKRVGEIDVQGEVSNFTQPASGHIYFTLKDSSAQIRCVFFRNRHSLNQSLQNGQEIVAKGILSVYEARGDYQLIVSKLHEAGLGDLHLLFEALKLKLAAAGLFEQSRKKTLPRFPNCIGVITSVSGAALRDILTTLKRRFPQALVLIYSCDVQGKTASMQLITSIMRANQDLRCEVLILARGGGSIEDLWAFNDEQLAYAIAGSQIPIVTGIGHETDFTIADFVADHRAATPTAAAELVTPDFLEWIAYFQTMFARLLAIIKRCLKHQQLVLEHCIQTLAAPERLVANYWQRLDYVERRLRTSMRHILTTKQHACRTMMAQLSAQHPTMMLMRIKMKLRQLEIQVLQTMKVIFERCQQQFQAQLTILNAVSPLATLDRGYALVTHHQRLVIDSAILAPKDEVNVRLAKGQMTCQVLKILDLKE